MGGNRRSSERAIDVLMSAAAAKKTRENPEDPKISDHQSGGQAIVGRSETRLRRGRGARKGVDDLKRHQ